MIAATLAWLRRNHYEVTLGTMCVAIALLAWRCSPDPAIPPREQATVDSLRATRTDFTARQEASAQRETVFVTRSVEEAHQATISTAAADSLRAVGNALQARAEAEHDTASTWHAVAIARGEEADTLRSALKASTRALELQVSARAAADERADGADLRLAAVDALNARLARDVKSAGECRVLWVVHCPTRRAAAIAGLAAGVVAHVVWEHRRP